LQKKYYRIYRHYHHTVIINKFFKFGGVVGGNRIFMYWKNIFCSLGILTLLSLCVLFYSGVKEGYSEIFWLAVVIAPMILIIIFKNNIKVDLFFAIATVSIILICAILFWKYKDGFLFNTIQGEERGYFSLENELELKLLSIWGLISVLISLLIRFVYTKLKVVKK